MPYTLAAKNAMLDYLASLARYVTLHDGDPGETGANEISGGSPPYSRALVTWATAANGTMSAATAPLFNVPAGTTIRYVGHRSAASGGTFYSYVAVPDRVFATQGLYRRAKVFIFAFLSSGGEALSRFFHVNFWHGNYWHTNYWAK